MKESDPAPHRKSDAKHSWLAFWTTVVTGVVLLMNRYFEFRHQLPTIIERQSPPLVINQVAAVQPPPVVILNPSKSRILPRRSR
jgi:hypothetical protein